MDRTRKELCETTMENTGTCFPLDEDAPVVSYCMDVEYDCDDKISDYSMTDDGSSVVNTVFPAIDWCTGVVGEHSITLNEFYTKYKLQNEMYLKLHCAESFDHVSHGDKLQAWNNMVQDCLDDIVILRVPSNEGSNDYIAHSDLVDSVQTVQEIYEGTESQQIYDHITQDSRITPGLHLICGIVSISELIGHSGNMETAMGKTTFASHIPLDRIKFKDSVSMNGIFQRSREPHFVKVRTFTRHCGLRKGGFVEIDHFNNYLHENKQFAQSEFYDLDIFHELHKWTEVFTGDIIMCNFGRVCKEVEVYKNTTRRKDCVLRLKGGGKCPSRPEPKDVESALVRILKLSEEQKKKLRVNVNSRMQKLREMTNDNSLFEGNLENTSDGDSSGDESNVPISDDAVNNENSDLDKSSTDEEQDLEILGEKEYMQIGDLPSYLDTPIGTDQIPVFFDMEDECENSEQKDGTRHGHTHTSDINMTRDTQYEYSQDIVLHSIKEYDMSDCEYDPFPSLDTKLKEAEEIFHNVNKQEDPATKTKIEGETDFLEFAKDMVDGCFLDQYTEYLRKNPEQAKYFEKMWASACKADAQGGAPMPKLYPISDGEGFETMEELWSRLDAQDEYYKSFQDAEDGELELQFKHIKVIDKPISGVGPVGWIVLNGVIL